MSNDRERLLEQVMGDELWGLGKLIGFDMWRSSHVSALVVTFDAWDMVVIGWEKLADEKLDPAVRFDLGDPGLIEGVRAEIKERLAEVGEDGFKYE